MLDALIATYREQRFDGKRVFELFADRIAIRGSRQFKSEFQISVSLRFIDPVPNRLWVRHSAFWGGVWMLLIAATVDTVLISSFHVAPESDGAGLVGCMGMAGLVLALATIRKVEFISFKNVAGMTVLDFARSGPDAAKLDEFIELVKKQIVRSESA